MSRRPSVAPLLIGTFIQRMNSGASTVIYGLLLLQEEAAKDRGLLMGLYSLFLGLGQIIGGGFGGIFARAFGFDGLIYLTV